MPVIDFDTANLVAVLSRMAINFLTAAGILLLGWLVSRWLEARFTAIIERSRP